MKAIRQYKYEDRNETRSKSAPQKDRQDTIIALFDGHEVIMRKDIEIALKVSQATAVLIIREMTASGKLINECGGKYSCYRRGSI